MTININPAKPNAPVDHHVLEEWDTQHPDHRGDAEYRHLLIEITNDEVPPITIAFCALPEEAGR